MYAKPATKENVLALMQCRSGMQPSSCLPDHLDDLVAEAKQIFQALYPVTNNKLHMLELTIKHTI